MSTRLQVVMDEEELEEIRAAAERNRMTVSEWVRQSLRRVRREEPRTVREHKLRVIREAMEHSFPTGDIEIMLEQIAAGRFETAG